MLRVLQQAHNRLSRLLSLMYIAFVSGINLKQRNTMLYNELGQINSLMKDAIKHGEKTNRKSTNVLIRRSNPKDVGL